MSDTGALLLCSCSPTLSLAGHITAPMTACSWVSCNLRSLHLQSVLGTSHGSQTEQREVEFGMIKRQGFCPWC
jgi:hypothetical protein